MQPACVVSQSVSQEAGRQVLHTDMFLIVEVPPLGSSQSRARHTHEHTNTHTHTHTTTSHILGCDTEAEEGEGGGGMRIYLPVPQRNSWGNIQLF